jgi:Tol biopolymer transport system component
LGRLAFVRAGNIWIEDLPAGEAHQLTQDGGASSPSWSASGSYVSFERDGQSWVQPLAGGEARALPQGADEREWSPTGDKLALGSAQGLSIYDARAGTTTSLPAHGAVTSIAWSPDGSRLAYVGVTGQAPSRVAAVDVISSAGEQPEELVSGGTPVSNETFILAGWSPDGQHLLYWRDPQFSASLIADGAELDAIATTGGQPQVVAKTMPVQRDALAWSPDGRLALVTGAGRATWQAKTLTVTSIGSTAAAGSDDGRADLYPAWSPNGLTIAYTSGPAAEAAAESGAQTAMSQRRTWLMKADGSAKHQVDPDASAREEYPRWSRDGRWILAGRPEGSTASLWLMHPDGSAQRQVATGIALPNSFFGRIDWPAAYAWWQAA